MEKEGEFEVETIQSFRCVNGIRQYLVRWKGYSADSDTWEPESNLSNCQSLLDAFWSRYNPIKHASKPIGLCQLFYNGEIVYFLDYGDTDSVVTFEYLSQHHPAELAEFLSG